MRKPLGHGAEFLSNDDGEYCVKTTFDSEPAIESAKARRLNGLHGTSDNRHVARVPAKLIHHLAVEAGVRMDDRQAMEELMTKKLLDGTLSKFRVWEGTF